MKTPTHGTNTTTTFGGIELSPPLTRPNRRPPLVLRRSMIGLSGTMPAPRPNCTWLDVINSVSLAHGVVLLPNNSAPITNGPACTRLCQSMPTNSSSQWCAGGTAGIFGVLDLQLLLRYVVSERVPIHGPMDAGAPSTNMPRVLLVLAEDSFTAQHVVFGLPQSGKLKRLAGVGFNVTECLYSETLAFAVTRGRVPTVPHNMKLLSFVSAIEFGNAAATTFDLLFFKAGCTSTFLCEMNKWGPGMLHDAIAEVQFKLSCRARSARLTIARLAGAGIGRKLWCILMPATTSIATILIKILSSTMANIDFIGRFTNAEYRHAYWPRHIHVTKETVCLACSRRSILTRKKPIP